MSRARTASFLRLVHDRNEPGEQQEIARFEPVQASLLADATATVFICTTEELDERGFVELFASLHARLALDLRISPRFDFGTLNRRKAFSLLEAFTVRYLDLGLKAPTLQACLEALASINKQEFADDGAYAHAPFNVVVLIDSEPDYRELGLAVGRHIRTLTASNWELVLRGPAEPIKPSRHTIFISHANPEDNNFVLWLQSQLQRLGYEVWSDLARLRAGEVFWDSIESVIRKDAIRVIVVVSETSQKKEGVLDEIALAISVERSERIAGFVIPIRIDNTPFSNLRANILRKNVLDFSESWAKGLNSLVSALRRDNVPRTGSSQQLEGMSRWFQQGIRYNGGTSFKPEQLISNRLHIDQLPARIYFLQGTPIHKSADSDALVPEALPFVLFRGGWLTFLSLKEVRSLGITGLTSQNILATDELLAGNVSISTGLRSFERERLVNRALNSHLQWSLAQRGLIYQPESKPPTLYVPRGLVEKDQAIFRDMDEKVRRRLLVGRSERRQLYWHLGMTAQFSIASQHLQIRLRVVFTTDGVHGLISADRMRDARRAFCKNWWNDRWRSLELALLAWLANGSESIVVHDGDAGQLLLNAKPQQFEVPVSIEEAPILENADAVADALASDSDDIDFDDQMPADADDDEWDIA